ncbi:hypothetical protein NDU88_010962 [Pleurodeles waltl]|uniref:Uncharacterized protein n=1 Tax=Pleurodeles waltl TaxID=8319 RepID=A0AAV7R219_PLEWA|nr:hypothetical protein NDU88_010962 [Pleurodeles waltl]
MHQFPQASWRVSPGLGYAFKYPNYRHSLCRFAFCSLPPAAESTYSSSKSHALISTPAGGRSRGGGLGGRSGRAQTGPGELVGTSPSPRTKFSPQPHPRSPPPGSSSCCESFCSAFRAAGLVHHRLFLHLSVLRGESVICSLATLCTPPLGDRLDIHEGTQLYPDFNCLAGPGQERPD